MTQVAAVGNTSNVRNVGSGMRQEWQRAYADAESVLALVRKHTTASIETTEVHGVEWDEAVVEFDKSVVTEIAELLMRERGVI